MLAPPLPPQMWSTLDSQASMHFDVMGINIIRTCLWPGVHWCHLDFQWPSPKTTTKKLDASLALRGLEKSQYWCSLHDSQGLHIPKLSDPLPISTLTIECCYNDPYLNLASKLSQVQFNSQKLLLNKVASNPWFGVTSDLIYIHFCTISCSYACCRHSWPFSLIWCWNSACGIDVVRSITRGNPSGISFKMCIRLIRGCFWIPREVSARQIAPEVVMDQAIVINCKLGWPTARNRFHLSIMCRLSGIPLLIHSMRLTRAEIPIQKSESVSHHSESCSILEYQLCSFSRC